MGVSFDFLPFFMAIGIGFLVIFIGIWHIEGRRIGHPKISSRVARLPGLRRKGSAEWTAAFSAASDLKSAMRNLTPEVQLEIAEHLVDQGDVFAADTLEGLERITLGSNVGLRRRAVNLLGLSSASPVAKVHVFEKVLNQSGDDVVRIDALGAMVRLLNDGVQDTHPVLVDSVIGAAASCLGDKSQKVRVAARELFAEDGPLYDFVPAIDDRIVVSLRNASGGRLNDLMVFVYRNESLLPHACMAVRTRDLRM